MCANLYCFHNHLIMQSKFYRYVSEFLNIGLNSKESLQATVRNPA